MDDLFKFHMINKQLKGIQRTAGFAFAGELCANQRSAGNELAGCSPMRKLHQFITASGEWRCLKWNMTEVGMLGRTPQMINPR